MEQSGPRASDQVRTSSHGADDEQGAASMEAVRKALEQLATPICGDCDVAMKWFRSELRPAKQAILHVFVCPGCEGVSEIYTPVKHRNE